MTKKLDGKKIEEARRQKTQSKRNEYEKQQIRDAFEANKTQKRVVIIPPKLITEVDDVRKTRVCAYCRVSTAEENQAGSFEIQCQHFKQYIENNPMWDFAGIFSDEGISGTSVEKRKGFQKMIEAAKNHDVDMILTKSISRFGRNIVDILTNLRLLSDLNPPVSVHFETEGIGTTDGKDSLIIMILSALAQLESQQKSEAIKAGIRYRMQEGIYKFSVINTLGYYRDHFGKIKIDDAEADIVRFIYDSFIEGASLEQIAEALAEERIKTPKELYKWRTGTIRNILSNEKYCGDALMQKTYTKNFLTHKSVKNRNFLPMYFTENHHDAIISREKWNRTQELLQSYNERRRLSNKVPLKIVPKRVIATKSKNGVIQGFFLLNASWTKSERAEFLKILRSLNNIENER